MTARLVFWIASMAYVVFLLVGRGAQLPLSVGSSAILIGAGAGLLVGLMFCNRARRKIAQQSR